MEDRPSCPPSPTKKQQQERHQRRSNASANPFQDLPDIAHSIIRKCLKYTRIPLSLISKDLRQIYGQFVTSASVRWQEGCKAEDLASLLHLNAKLSTLKVSHSKTLAPLVAAIGQGHCKSVKYIGIYIDSPLDTEASRVLAKVFDDDGLPSLETFCLGLSGGGKLNLGTIKALLEHLSKGASPKLTELRLPPQLMPQENLEALADALEARVKLGCCYGLTMNPFYSDLYKPAAKDVLGRIIRSCIPTLKRIDVSSSIEAELYAKCLATTTVPA